MSKYIFYNSISGAITKVMECNDEDAHLNQEEGELSMVASLDTKISDESHYIDVETGKVLNRKALILPKFIPLQIDQEWEVTLPESFSLAIQGDTEEYLTSEDNFLYISFETPGRYILYFSFPTYESKRVVIHVQES